MIALEIRKCIEMTVLRTGRSPVIQDFNIRMKPPAKKIPYFKTGGKLGSYNMKMIKMRHMLVFRIRSYGKRLTTIKWICNSKRMSGKLGSRMYFHLLMIMGDRQENILTNWRKT